MSQVQYPYISRENNFDVVRLFAALQVCTGHILSHFNIDGGLFSSILSFFPGVTIFFVISGFLITSSWCRSKSMKQYARNRFLRIFPALFICFIVVQLALVIFGQYDKRTLLNPQVWAYWVGQLTLGQFFTPDAFRDFGVGSPNGSLWTIPIEVEFYILIPLIFIFLTRINIQKKLILIGVLSLIANIVLSLYTPSATHTNAEELMNGFGAGNATLVLKLLNVSVFPYLYCFIIGALLYLNWDKIQIYFVNKAPYWLLAYFVIILLLRSKPGNNIDSIQSFICNLLLCGSTISSAFSFGKINRYLMGVDISYGVYIIHMIIVNIMLELGYGSTVTDAVIAIIITIILALLMYIYVEKPALSLKNPVAKK